MPAGGLVEAAFSRRGQTAFLSVKDRGEGFKPRNPEVLFRPFFTTKPTGTGLGLAIARSILQSHGGRIWAVRNKPRGTTFHLKWKG